MDRPLNTTTAIVHHPVSLTADYLYGQATGFPPGNQFLCSPVIRRVQFALVAREVVRFDDGLYHAEVHPFGMYDLLGDMSAHDAELAGFDRLELTKPDPSKQMFVLFGIRWEVSPKHRLLRVYGPKSDPENTLVIDLTDPQGEL